MDRRSVLELAIKLDIEDVVECCHVQVDVLVFLSDCKRGILQNLHHARQELQHHVPLAAREATVEDLQFVRNLRGVPLIVLAAHLLEAGLHPWVLLQPVLLTSDIDLAGLHARAWIHARSHVERINDEDILPLSVLLHQPLKKEVAHIIDPIPLVKLGEIDLHKSEAFGGIRIKKLLWKHIIQNAYTEAIGHSRLVKLLNFGKCWLDILAPLPIFLCCKITC
mmetsp:Transcript_35897/g.83844  ORF Transcript_35897/g.83844 Transcript_35897/m.83844 type:complete len:222 (+) Transcript_35897:125-790(+)